MFWLCDIFSHWMWCFGNVICSLIGCDVLAMWYVLSLDVMFWQCDMFSHWMWCFGYVICSLMGCDVLAMWYVLSWDVMFWQCDMFSHWMWCFDNPACVLEWRSAEVSDMPERSVKLAPVSWLDAQVSFLLRRLGGLWTASQRWYRRGWREQVVVLVYPLSHWYKNVAMTAVNELYSHIESLPSTYARHVGLTVAMPRWCITK